MRKHSGVALVVVGSISLLVFWGGPARADSTSYDLTPSGGGVVTVDHSQSIDYGYASPPASIKVQLHNGGPECMFSASGGAPTSTFVDQHDVGGSNGLTGSGSTPPVDPPPIVYSMTAPSTWTLTLTCIQGGPSYIVTVKDELPPPPPSPSPPPPAPSPTAVPSTPAGPPPASPSVRASVPPVRVAPKPTPVIVQTAPRPAVVPTPVVRHTAPPAASPAPTPVPSPVLSASSTPILEAPRSPTPQPSVSLVAASRGAGGPGPRQMFVGLLVLAGVALIGRSVYRFRSSR